MRIENELGLIPSDMDCSDTSFGNASFRNFEKIAKRK